MAARQLGGMKQATRTISLGGVIRDGDSRSFHQRQAWRAAHRQGAAMSQVVPESASSLRAELRTLITSSWTKGKKAP